MFKKWLAIFKKDTLMDRAYSHSFRMLDITRDMFLMAKKSLRHTEDNKIEIDIYDKDIEVNRYEREVRREVLAHLVTTGTDALPSGLVLVSIIIDIERIGDYTKNMIELAMNHPEKLHGGKFEDQLQKIEKAVEENFNCTRECFQSGDSKTAIKILEDFTWVNKSCDDALIALIKEDDKDISPGNAVSLAMYFRWLKRINSHLRNIITSMVNPFDRIGFNPKDR